MQVQSTQILKYTQVHSFKKSTQLPTYTISQVQKYERDTSRQLEKYKISKVHRYTSSSTQVKKVDK